MLNLDRQHLLNVVSAVARFVPGDAVASLTRNQSGELLVRAVNEDGTAGAEQTVEGVRLSGADLAMSLAALRAVARYSESDKLKIRGDQDRLLLTSDRAEFRLTLAEEGEVPEPPALPPGGTKVRLTSCVLSGLYSRVRFALCKQVDTCPWATGAISVRADPQRLSLTATDSFSAATDPVEPAPNAPQAELPANWVRRRSDIGRPSYRYVRRCKAGAYQARVHLGRLGGSLNLGLFTRAEHGDDAEWAAAQTSKAFMREWRPGRTVGEAVDALKRAGRVPCHVEVPAGQRILVPQTAGGVERKPRLVTLADVGSGVLSNPRPAGNDAPASGHSLAAA
jgi:hypothetical protein